MLSSLVMAMAGTWRGKQHILKSGLSKLELLIFHHPVSSTWYKLPSRASLKWHTICRSYLLFEIAFLYCRSCCSRLFSLQHGASSPSKVKPSGRVKCCPSSRTLAMSWCGGLAMPLAHSKCWHGPTPPHQFLLLSLEGSQLPSLPWGRINCRLGPVSLCTCV